MSKKKPEKPTPAKAASLVDDELEGFERAVAALAQVPKSDIQRLEAKRKKRKRKT